MSDGLGVGAHAEGRDQFATVTVIGKSGEVMAPHPGDTAIHHPNPAGIARESRVVGGEIGAGKSPATDARDGRSCVESQRLAATGTLAVSSATTLSRYQADGSRPMVRQARLVTVMVASERQAEVPQQAGCRSRVSSSRVPPCALVPMAADVSIAATRRRGMRACGKERIMMTVVAASLRLLACHSLGTRLLVPLAMSMPDTDY